MPMKTIFNTEEIEKKILLILRILHESPEPMGARIISRRMQEHGVALSERGVRYHLKMMDDRGLTGSSAGMTGAWSPRRGSTRSPTPGSTTRSAFPYPASRFWHTGQPSTWTGARGSPL